ncbi:MAG: hypothetical protein O2820_09025 [Planctomycetota bacterium]|nr:hypothetical protein [Planctomycetota bacterium]MDA1249354.1 hypothetical protein [Planctomycetota bacterium]
MREQRYFDAINGDPSRAMFDWERQELSCFLDEKKFGTCRNRTSAGKPAATITAGADIAIRQGGHSCSSR